MKIKLTAELNSWVTLAIFVWVMQLDNWLSNVFGVFWLVVWIFGFAFMFIVLAGINASPQKFSTYTLEMHWQGIAFFVIATLLCISYNWWVSAFLVTGTFFLLCRVIEYINSTTRIFELQKLIDGR